MRLGKGLSTPLYACTVALYAAQLERAQPLLRRLPQKNVVVRYVALCLALWMLWKAIDLYPVYHYRNIYSCGPGDHFRRPFPSIRRRKFLIGRLQALTRGHQLGSLVFEILGFEAVARKANRIPVIIVDDPANKEALPNIWSVAYYFPKIFDGYRFWRNPTFNFTAHPSVNFTGNYSTFHSGAELQGLQIFRTVTSYAGYFENYKYLDMLTKDYVAQRLSTPRHTVDLVYDLVPAQFHRHEMRLCAHLRRDDFTASARLNETAAIVAIKKLLRREGSSSSVGSALSLGDDFGLVIFSDASYYMKAMHQSAPFNGTSAQLYPLVPTAKDQPLPKHYVWRFMQCFCTHIYLSSSRPTFAFFGAYLSPPTTKVFFSPQTDAQDTSSFDLPADWIPWE